MALCSAAGSVTHIHADMTRPDEIREMIRDAEARFGVDILVNNAGFTWDGMLHKMTDEQVQGSGFRL